MDLIAMLMGGLLGSGHCIGMCGGFVVTIGASKQRFSPTLIRQLCYGGGRIFTYGFLGALAGLVGARLASLNLPLVDAQNWLAIIAGIMMLMVGLSNLGVFRFKKSESACIGFGDKMLGHFLKGNGYAASLLAGVFTGFLPCGLLYTFLALAMKSGSPALGWLGMVLFGVGTIPALTVLGCGSAVMSQVSRVRLHRLASCFVILLGIATIWRGVPKDKPCCDPADHPVVGSLHVPFVDCIHERVIDAEGRGRFFVSGLV
ncbi:MAG: sulfite exporter TauE/SafE family protein [Phycisphaerae bacterium]|nr:sulfite exporter TauE/SafE family protein [Phycisphaerales bacterium]